MTPELTPTVVLVHGAFAESNGWNGVIAGLQAQDLVAVALANPLRALHSDAEYLASVLANIAGPVVLVAHSYGGMLATEVGAASDGVKALGICRSLCAEYRRLRSRAFRQVPGQHPRRDPGQRSPGRRHQRPVHRAGAVSRSVHG